MYRVRLSSIFNRYFSTFLGVYRHTVWYNSRSLTLWSPLTCRIDHCKRLTVLQYYCKTQLWSRFCVWEGIFPHVYISCCDINYDIIILGEIGNIYRDYIGVYVS